MLHDDVLLEIFSLCINRFHQFPWTDSDDWQTLVHVCQRWRYLIFAFPNHLNVRLRRSREKPVREMLSIWPTLPIVVSGDVEDIEDDEDVFVALEQRDRVCEINIEGYPCSNLLGTVVDAMLVPFPALKRLSLIAIESRGPVIPDTFLGGSAPRLRSLYLGGIPFPALPSLLLSARGLVTLRLSDIPRSGTFLPEVMVNSISDLSRLEKLHLDFRSRRSCPVSKRRSPPVARAVFPALQSLFFTGIPEYLDDLVSRIDAPRIWYLYMTFFNQPFVTSDFCQLRQFIGRAEQFKSLTHAYISFRGNAAELSLTQRTKTHYGMASVRILCTELHPQLWSLSQVGSASLLPLSDVESLELSTQQFFRGQLDREHSEEDARWLNVLQPFSAVKNLYPHEATLPSLAYALKEVPEDRVTEVLPALQVLTLNEPESPSPGGLDMPFPPAVEEAIERFIAMRHLRTVRVDHNYRLDRDYL